MHDRDEVLLVLGALALLMVTGEPVEWGDPSLWAWPVPDASIIGLRHPAEISNGFVVPTHYGVDVMYRGDMSAMGFELFDHSNDTWFAPNDTPVLAARAGTVYSVDKSPRGIEVVLDHGPPWATYYQHLSAVQVAKGDKVAAGQRIGTMGFDPTDPEGLRHLHFATWYKGAGDSSSVDPERQMMAWKRTLWTRGQGNV